MAFSRETVKWLCTTNNTMLHQSHEGIERFFTRHEQCIWQIYSHAIYNLHLKLELDCNWKTKKSKKRKQFYSACKCKACVVLFSRISRTCGRYTSETHYINEHVYENYILFWSFKFLRSFWLYIFHWEITRECTDHLIVLERLVVALPNHTVVHLPYDLLLSVCESDHVEPSSRLREPPQRFRARVDS